MVLIKNGDRGPVVLKAQKLLNKAGHKLKEDGIFGNVTEYAVKAFQNKAGLLADGIIGPKTWQTLEKIATTSYHRAFNKVVDQYIPMNDNEFIKEKSFKKGITYHHTVSDGNPSLVVRNWEHDRRGPVGTHFVIGRTLVNGDQTHDGQIVQCIPMEYWAHHVLTSRMGFSRSHNELMNKSYIGIELCSWGALKKENGKFYTLDGRVRIPDNQVATLYTPFRTYRYWHKFSHAQIEALYRLTVALKQRFNMDFQKDGPISDWFELSWEALALRRILTTHTNFEYGKFDTFPQAELKSMIHQLYKL